MYFSRIVFCIFDYLLYGGEFMFFFVSVFVLFVVVYFFIFVVRVWDFFLLGKYLIK